MKKGKCENSGVRMLQKLQWALLRLNIKAEEITLTKGGEGGAGGRGLAASLKVPGNSKVDPEPSGQVASFKSQFALTSTGNWAGTWPFIPHCPRWKRK